MKHEVALFAAKNIARTSIKRKNAVQKSAQINYVAIESIEELGKEPVYNMEVAKFHNFSVNGGIIVHNCMDDIRYFCSTIMRRRVRELI